MRRDEAMQALRAGLRARAAWGYPHDHSDTRAEGKVIGYSEKPMVLILTDDGERVWWAEELVYAAPTGESA